MKKFVIMSGAALVLLIILGQLPAANRVAMVAALSFTSSQQGTGVNCIYCTKGRGSCRRVSAQALHYNLWGVKKSRGNIQCSSRERGHGAYSCWDSPVNAMVGWMNMVRTSKYYFGGGKDTVFKVSRAYVAPDKWVPGADNNKWARFVASKMGISQHQRLDANDPAMLVRFMVAVSKKENSCRGFYSPQDVSKAVEIVFGSQAVARGVSGLTRAEAGRNQRWSNQVRAAQDTNYYPPASSQQPVQQPWPESQDWPQEGGKYYQPERYYNPFAYTEPVVSAPAPISNPYSQAGGGSIRQQPVAYYTPQQAPYDTVDSALPDCILSDEVLAETTGGPKIHKELCDSATTRGGSLTTEEPYRGAPVVGYIKLLIGAATGGAFSPVVEGTRISF